MPVNLGERIRAARKAAGLTQRQLADKIQVSNTSISNWEKGTSRPDPDTIQHLCWALNVEPNFFFKGAPQYTLVQTPPEGKNVIELIGRDGSYQKRTLTDQQLAAFLAILDQMPDVPEDL